MSISIRAKKAMIYAIIAYILLYLLSAYHKPVTFRDSQVGILNKHPNIISHEFSHNFKYSFLSNKPIAEGIHRVKQVPHLVYIKGEERIPLLLQERQGGAPFYIFNLFNKVVGKHYSMHLWHMIISIFSIIIMHAILRRLFPINIANIGILLLAIDPLEIFSHSFDISEPLTKLALLAIILALIKKKTYTAGLLTGIAIYIKITTLWVLVPTLILCKIKNLKSSTHFLLGALVPLIPYFFMIRLSTLFTEVQNSNYAPFSLTLFAELSAALLNKTIFFKFLFSSPSYSWFDYFLIIISLFPFVLSLRYYKQFKGIYLWLILFVLFIFVSVSKYTYHYYLFPLSLYSCFFTTTLISAVQHSRYRQITIFAILGIQIIQSAYFIFHYRKSELDVVINQKVFTQIISDLKKQKEYTPYVIGGSDFTKYEFLSDEVITPINLSPVITQRLSGLALLLSRLKMGTVIIPLKDRWSQWSHFWPKGINPKQVIRKGKKIGIVFSNQKYYGPPHNAIWKFTFINNRDSIKNYE